jgi:hypothetical protein
MASSVSEFSTSFVLLFITGGLTTGGPRIAINGGEKLSGFSGTTETGFTSGTGDVALPFAVF